MFYYLYKITNVINDKIYVGVHKTKNLDDGYMGSGKVIKRALEKHGILNFKKDILELFDTSEAMYAKEAEVVNEEFLQREDVYNLRRGGHGGFDYLNSGNFYNPTHSKEQLSSISKLGGIAFSKRMSEDLDFSNNFKHNLSIRLKSGGSAFLDKSIGNEMRLRSQSPIVMIKRKSTYIEIEHQQGEKNSQFGMMWITNEVESKKIKKTDLIPEGFRKGRVIKK